MFLVFGLDFFWCVFLDPGLDKISLRENKVTDLKEFWCFISQRQNTNCLIVWSCELMLWLCRRPSQSHELDNACNKSKIQNTRHHSLVSSFAQNGIFSYWGGSLQIPLSNTSGSKETFHSQQKIDFVQNYSSDFHSVVGWLWPNIFTAAQVTVRSDKISKCDRNGWLQRHWITWHPSCSNLFTALTQFYGCLEKLISTR